ncbi:MAG: hypothetical protein Q9187_000325 [Circinaria calcarea]
MGFAPIPYIIHDLNRLPRELVYKILDDLPLYQILKLLVRNDPYVSSCIQNHIYYRTLFSSDDVSAVKTSFVLWFDIVQRNHQDHHHIIPVILEQTYASVPRTSLPTLETLQAKIDDSIANMLFVREPQLAIIDALERSGRAVRLPENLDTDCNENRWLWMKAQQQALNDVKSAQLYRLADLLFTYPHMLKKTSDPGEGARSNFAHIINRLHREGLRVQKDWIFRKNFCRLKNLEDIPPIWSYGKKPKPGESVTIRSHLKLHGAYLFDSDELPLVPIQKYRQFFRRTLLQNPPLRCTTAEKEEIGETTSIVDEISSLLKTLNWIRPQYPQQTKAPAPAPPSRPPTLHAYPATIVQDLRTVLVGLRDGHQKRQPHLYWRKSLPLRRDPLKVEFRLFPHEERQLKWLEAVCRCCGYMEEMVQGVGARSKEGEREGIAFLGGLDE